MFDRLEKVAARYDELTMLLADPAIINNQDRYRELSKEHSDISAIVATYHRYKKAKADVDNLRQLANGSDPEMRELAFTEMDEAEAQERAYREACVELAVRYGVPLPLVEIHVPNRQYDCTNGRRCPECATGMHIVGKVGQA